jgi:hypothetical protein
MQWITRLIGFFLIRAIITSMLRTNLCLIQIMATISLLQTQQTKLRKSVISVLGTPLKSGVSVYIRVIFELHFYVFPIIYIPRLP